MKPINWTAAPNVDRDEVPAEDPDEALTRERPEVTQEALDRAALRESAEHRVLRNMARQYAGYYGPRS